MLLIRVFSFFEMMQTLRIYVLLSDCLAAVWWRSLVLNPLVHLRCATLGKEQRYAITVTRIQFWL